MAIFFKSISHNINIKNKKIKSIYIYIFCLVIGDELVWHTTGCAYEYIDINGAYIDFIPYQKFKVHR